jgi:hypothetical protein
VRRADRPCGGAAAAVNCCRARMKVPQPP